MAWPIRRPPRVSAGSRVAVRVSRWPTPEPPRRSSSEPSSTRVLLDLTDARPSARLAAARAAIPRAIALAGALGAGDAVTAPARPTRRRGPAAAARHDGSRSPSRLPAAGPPDDDPDASTDEEAGPARIPAVERRRGVEILLGLWADVARDLALVGSGGARSVHDTVLLDELSAISAAIPPGSAGAFLARAARSAELLAGNVSPELVLDALVLSWPSRSAAA